MIVLFLCFSVFIIWQQNIREKEIRKEALYKRLNAYALMIDNYASWQKGNDDSLRLRVSSLKTCMPDELRYTIIDSTGTVIFDNRSDFRSMENHGNRPEIASALIKGSGISVRHSATLNKDYVYYALYDKPIFIRISLPYDIAATAILSSDRIFMYIVILLFFAIMFLLMYISGRFGESFRKLQKEANIRAALQMENEHLKLQRKNMRASIKRHLDVSGDGICVFDPSKRIVYNNASFIRYLNVLLGTGTLEIPDILKDPLFEEELSYIDNVLKSFQIIQTAYPIYERNIGDDEDSLAVRIIFFCDKSFEIQLLKR
jgi:PAS domain-containing protein/type II secretory pathway pseudopilin PulG